MTKQESPANSFSYIVRKSMNKDEMLIQFREDVITGLSKKRKALPSKWFYDTKGSELFQQIMDMPEYYLTDCEKDILTAFGPTIADSIPHQMLNIIEFGAGDGRKTRILLEAFSEQKEIKYIPIDISEKAMKEMESTLDNQFGDKEFESLGLVTDYLDGLRWLNKQGKVSNLILFLGSNIGNFTKERATKFIKEMYYAMNSNDYALIGFDLVKNPEIMVPAYSDKQGITRDFNLNLLTRINRDLGGDFKTASFEHQAVWNEKIAAMESWLISKGDQTVKFNPDGSKFHFAKEEKIHMEYSNKYTREKIDTLLIEAGFEVIEHFTDKILSNHEAYFADTLAKKP